MSRRYKIMAHDRTAYLTGAKSTWDVWDSLQQCIVASGFELSDDAKRQANKLEREAERTLRMWDRNR